MAKEKVIAPPVVEFNVYCNDKPVGTHADQGVAVRIGQHAFSEEMYAGNPAPVIRVTKRTVHDGEVTEEDI